MTIINNFLIGTFQSQLNKPKSSVDIQTEITYSSASRKEAKVQTNDVISVNMSSQTSLETNDVMIQAQSSCFVAAVQAVVEMKHASVQTDQNNLIAKGKPLKKYLKSVSKIWPSTVTMIYIQIVLRARPHQTMKTDKTHSKKI